jgi:hypothetical protein
MVQYLPDGGGCFGHGFLLLARCVALVVEYSIARTSFQQTRAKTQKECLTTGVKTP